jgi:hypothetical protein
VPMAQQLVLVAMAEGCQIALAAQRLWAGWPGHAPSLTVARGAFCCILRPKLNGAPRCAIPHTQRS